MAHKTERDLDMSYRDAARILHRYQQSGKMNRYIIPMEADLLRKALGVGIHACRLLAKKEEYANKKEIST